MKVLVVGGGGREHAILHALKKSPEIEKLYAAPGNGGIAAIAECVDMKATDIAAVCAFVKREGIGFVVVAPDDPLVLGMVDALEEMGVKTFGPNRAAARVEGSKVFSKELMRKYNIPTAAWEAFSDAGEAKAYIRAGNSYPTVIKAEGLALGKGVILAKDYAEAENAIGDIMEKKIFGDSGSRVVIEEFLTGPEVSVLAFTDGETLCPMVSAQDHKRAFDHDEGPNTGGMGTFSPSRVYTPEIAKICMETIFMPTIRAMAAEGCPFKGCLYFGLMLTERGPKVIEYNARFGDPETQVVLPRLKTDLFAIMQAIADGRLGEIDIEWADNAAACVVLASGGYPGAYETGHRIDGLEAAGQMAGVTVYHAGTKRVGGEIVTSGGRVLGVTATADTLDAAIKKAYDAVKCISFKGMRCRSDIGIK